MPRIVRHVPHLIFIAEIALVFWIFHNIAYETTYRLFMSHRVDDASQSTATQRFDIEGGRVVPQIAMRPMTGSDRIAFASALGKASTLHVDLRPEVRAHFEVRWRDAATSRVLATGHASAGKRLTVPVPTERGVIELASDGPLTWVDPRLVRDLHIGPHTIALTLLMLLSVALAQRRRTPEARRSDDGATARVIWFRRIALAAGVLFIVASLEIALRALGERVPPAIAAERHDLGELMPDRRWEDTRRYGRRLRVRVDAINEWRHGDIVRMGYIPPEVSDGTLHRFRFRTDDEGFRNAATRARIDVATLGDSFTDAMTLDASDSWTSVLERRTGLAVQNYGTAGFGPQQELRVLTDYVVRHRPRVVVLAFFAGNDLFDAEAFDEFERSNGTIQRAALGWPIKDVVSRADNWFVVSALRAAGSWASRHQRAEAMPIGEARPPRAMAAGSTPVFDRGMFTALVNGTPLRWAFMPPYLNTLRFSAETLAARRGWTLTTRAITEMQRVTREIGADFIVMFLPFKSQIYLPLLESSMPATELSRGLQFYLRDDLAGATPPDIGTMMRNRLAQNTLMRRFCAEAGIRFLDTTDALAERVHAGGNVYFPDESHLNEAGHRIVADTLANFLDR